MFKRCKVVMLPTNQKAKVGMINLEPYNREGHKLELIHYVTNGDGLNPQHLYILSDDEIKEGDWSYHPVSKNIKQADTPYYSEFGWKKIIATTDKSIVLNVHGTGSVVTPEFLPESSQSFIEKYITEYNKGNVISDILIEYEQYHGINTSIAEINAISGDDSMNWKGKGDSRDFQLKVSKDNTITIKRVKDSWSREEVIKSLKNICQDAIFEPEIFITGIYFDKDKFNKWIEENL